MNEEELFTIMRELATKTIYQLKKVDKLTPKEMADETAANCTKAVLKVKELEQQTYES